MILSDYDNSQQILKFDHADLVATVIRDDIDYLDLSLSQANISSEDRATTRKIIGTDHVSLGSPCTPLSFSDLEQQQSGDIAFKDFRKKLGRFFTRYFGKTIRFKSNDEVE